MQLVRRILVVLLFLAFGLGMPAHSVQAGDMGSAAQTVTEGFVPDDCGSCGIGQMEVAVCASAACVGATAVPVRASLASRAGDAAFDLMPEERFSSSAGGPDPFPPKLTVL